MFAETQKDIENKSEDVGRIGMSYDEFKQLCRKSREDEYNYLCFDRSKKRDQGGNCNCSESTNTYIESTSEKNAFWIT